MIRPSRLATAVPVIPAGGISVPAPSEPVCADQVTAVPLPRRQPGTHGAKVVKADAAETDPATLRKVIDGLNRM
jgi:hypothetical protein